MASIRNSVGLAGVNATADVRVVQELLNANLRLIPSIERLEPDGACGRLTRAAIHEFQRVVVKMRNPDDRVDPGGTTLRRLNGEAAPDALNLRYNSLEASYPAVHAPCDQGYENQCAIRMSVSLIGAGFSFTSYTEPICRHGHARGAESLAQFLSGRRRPERFTSSTARTNIAGRSGIVFFRNISGFRGGQGDHIDLWDGTGTMTGEYFGRASEVWFWAVE